MGASWGDLGASWEGLGASRSGLLGACWHESIFNNLLDRFWTDLGAQNEVQHRQTLFTNIMIRYEGFQVPLGSVLGQSWAVLGSILGSHISQIHWFHTGSVNIVFLKKTRLRSASWTDLRYMLTPTGLAKDTQIGPNMDQTWDRKTIKQ